VALALVTLAGIATASPPLEAIRMAWDDCQISAGANRDNPFLCSTNFGSGSLYCGFSVAQPIDQVVGLELVVDIQHSLASLPDYWRLGPLPDCRHDMLSASLDFSATTECVDPVFGGALVQDYIEGQPGGLTSQARIKAVVFIPSPDTRSFATDTVYHAIRLVLSYDRTQNVGFCQGCTYTACLVLNSILVRRVAGAVGGDVMLTQPGSGNANWTTWRVGNGSADCAAVPVQNLTWGRIKSLYR